jgi:PDZ domain-containing protein
VSHARHDEVVAPGPPPPAPSRVRGPGRIVAGLLTAVFVLVIVAAGLTFVSLPYVTLAPGPATNILGDVDGTPVLTIDGAPTYPTDGSLDFTTVIFDGGPGRTVTVYDLLFAWLSPDTDVTPEGAYFPPDTTAEEVETENAEMMNDSQVVAAATALRALGTEVPTTVRVAAVPESGPSAGKLEPGDQLVSVDGQDVTTAQEVRDIVQPLPEGTDVEIVVRRDGSDVTVDVTTEESGGRSIIGVLLGLDYDLPVTVTLNTGSVGGPSAGLMFSLSIYDQLTRGPLTGGQSIAGTGTIEDDGSVGPISGVAQKMVGAHEAGARWFLTPAEECPATLGRVPDGMTVVRVSTFDEAREAVEDIAAGTTDDLPRCD